jgi:hypothetical protein
MLHWHYSELPCVQAYTVFPLWQPTITGIKRQCAYNVTLWRVRVTTVAVETQRSFPLSYSPMCACQDKPLSATMETQDGVPFVAEMKSPVSNFTKIRQVGAALILVGEKTNRHDEDNGHTAQTYANAPNNIFSACTVVFFPSGFPSYPSNGASCVSPPAMLYFRCLCILCQMSETKRQRQLQLRFSAISTSFRDA